MMKSCVFALFFFIELFSCFFHTFLAFSLKSCTIGSLDNIVEVMCQKRGLAEVPDDIPLNSKILDLSFNNISVIKTKDFLHLSELISLALSDNKINHIEDKAFTDLNELKTLRISYNKLTNLTDGIFVGLTNLVSLLLNSNYISQISPKAFEPLVSLHRVILDVNHIGRIRDLATLFQLPNIELISFSYNNITFFDSDDLPLNASNVRSLIFGLNFIKRFSLKRDIFPYLQSFDFSSSKMLDWDLRNKTFLRSVTKMYFGRTNKVNVGTFISMIHSTSSLKLLVLESSDGNSIKNLLQVACSIPSMTNLTVSFNTLGVIDDNFLRPCSNVRELFLPANSLNELSGKSLETLTKLRLLDLDANRLRQVPPTIRHLTALEILDLSSNYIGEISCLDFANLTKLTTLNLRRNRIVDLDECVFQNLHNLKSIDVGKNSVHSFRNAFRVNMSKLERLIFDNNAYRFVLQQGEFLNLTSLQMLNLDLVQYFFSPDGVFEGLNRLQNLICSTGQFSKHFFQGLLELKYLVLHLRPQTQMNISLLGNSEPPFSGLINLQQLSLIAYPRFTMTVSPDFFRGLKSLEYLKADNFFQTSIHPDTFQFTPQLLSLEIINSGLSVLAPDIFHPILKLLKLNLSNNKFSTLDFLANTKALRLLKATDNLLAVINETIFQTLPNLTYLDIRNNPFICDCLNANFQQWVLTTNHTQVINGHQYKCVSPDTQQTHNFLNLDTRSCWIDFGFICFISSCCFVVLTLFVSFVYSFLRWQIAYAYYLFLAYVYDAQVKKKGLGGHHYDAFISYNVHDEDWVYSEMLPMLEGRQGWRLCLHHRDFEPGKPIVENITDAIYGSRKTICVISQQYLQSEWCSREIQMASVRLFDEKKDVLILVFLEDIPTWRLSPYYQIRRLVKKHTYLSWPQAAKHKGVFWQKLNQALKTGNAPNDNRHLIIEPDEDM